MRMTITRWAILFAVALTASAWAMVIAVALPSPAAAAAPGDLVWMQTWYPKSAFEFKSYPETDLAPGPGGDVWLASQAKNSSSDNPYVRRIVVARYTPAGVKRWGVVLPSQIDMVYVDFAVDHDGNAIVGSWSVTDSAKRLWSITKLSPSGKRLWVRTRSFTQVLNSASGAFAGIAVDSNRNIYVVGTIARAATGDDVALSKFSSAGALKWTRFINGFGTSDDLGVAVGVDGSNRVYVTGTVGGFFSGTNIVLARYTPAGAQVWNRVWDGVGKDDSVAGLAVSAAGVAVAGKSRSSDDRDFGVVVTATPTMADGVLPLDKVSQRTGYLSWTSVAMNANGTVAVGGSYTEGQTYFATAIFPSGFASGDSQYLVNPDGSSSCDSISLLPDDVAYATGWWATPGSVGDVFVQRVTFASSPWTSSKLGLDGQQIAKVVLATRSGVYVAGQAGSSIGLWKFQP